MQTRNLTFPQNLVNELNVPQMQDICDSLPVNRNWTWFTMPTREDANGNDIAGPRDIGDISTIILHHSGVAKSKGCTAASHANAHIANKAYSSKGEPGIPYHFYIKDSQAYQTNDILAFTYGVGSNNYYTVHICVEGDYKNYDTLTDADRRALIATILTVKEALPAFSGIMAHCELNKTDCPGYDYKSIIQDAVTLGKRLSDENSWEGKNKKKNQVVSEINYLFELIKKGPNDGDAVWAMNHYLDLYDYMKQRKLL